MPHPLGMNSGSLTEVQQQPNGSSFDLFRLTKSKSAVDLAPNTVRGFHALGLPFYKRGRIVFVSKLELHHFIRTRFTQRCNT